jgi:transcriptional regulator with XRE-family HTH domain
MTVSEKIRLLARRRGITITALAGKIGMTRQNLNMKLKNDNFTVKDLQEIAVALNCSFDTVFTMNDTGEKV